MEKIVVETTPAPWRDMLLLCGKCSRKLGGGFGKKENQDYLFWSTLQFWQQTLLK